jgi:glycine/D-amino acid oxidase-like deaminating enzyme
MKLCMFSPRDNVLDRGWPGRIDEDVVVQLAAQTLQAFFTGGGTAREHAEYPLAGVVFRAPVLHPPSVRIFDESGDFAFANPAAIKAAGERPGVVDAEEVERVAAIIGADGAIGGFTPLVEWVAPQLVGAKQRDFALELGPVVTTPDEGAPPGVDWEQLVAHAAENTTLFPGDLIVR